MDLAGPLAAGYEEQVDGAVRWFSAYGFWVVLLGGFSPIPYKVFTIVAGAITVPLLPFVAASLVGRGSRFYLLTGLVRWGEVETAAPGHC